MAIFSSSATVASVTTAATTVFTTNSSVGSSNVTFVNTGTQTAFIGGVAATVAASIPLLPGQQLTISGTQPTSTAFGAIASTATTLEIGLGSAVSVV
jgi:hypothetical protein